MEGRIARYKIILIVLAAALSAVVGFVLAPPRAEAHRGGLHTELHHGATARAANVSGGRVHTQLRHAPGPRAANVSGGALHIQGQGGFIDTASPTFLIADGTGEGTAETVCTGLAVLDGVTAAGTGTIEVTGDADFDGTAEDIMWRGVATTENGMVETMLGGKQTFSGSDLQVTAAPGLQWIVYGFCADALDAFQAEEMRAKAQEIMGR